MEEKKYATQGDLGCCCMIILVMVFFVVLSNVARIERMHDRLEALERRFISVENCVGVPSINDDSTMSPHAPSVQ